MDNNLRNIIIQKILESIPSHAKLVNYLMQALNISRESVYRRMKGDIPFTIEEIIKLSKKLNFSLDELVGGEKEFRFFFDIPANTLEEPAETYLQMIDQQYQGLLNLQNAKHTESFIVLNYITPVFAVFSDELFKFLYYRWMHQNREISLKYYYSDVVLPDALVFMQKKIKALSPKVDTMTFVLDPDIFINIIRDVQYCYQRKLIDEDTFQCLREDIWAMLNQIETFTQTGVSNMGSQFNLYLSSVSVKANSYYIEYDDKRISYFHVYFIKPITINNPDICNIHKKWIESLKKYATLITQSNEILQAKYFNQQRAYLENIENFSFHFFQ
jgi:hypothetical protein